MKKCSLFLMIILIFFCFSGCVYEARHNSLNEYKALIKRLPAEHSFGYSNVGLDTPRALLPSFTFLDDYEYSEGSFNYYDRSEFTDLFGYTLPDRVLITLKYEEAIYQEAKSFILEQSIVYNNQYYYYNDYCFYKRQGAPHGSTKFNMVGYNDEKSMLFFLGFSLSYPVLEEKYEYHLEDNFKSFLDEY